MNKTLSELKNTFFNYCGHLPDATGVLAQIQRIERDIRRLNFSLERAVRDKQTLATLLSQTSEDLEVSYALIKQIFGRYLSTEVMNSLLENPGALELGGDRRYVTIMMTDLRGFTAIAEQLKPEDVVRMLNIYFDVMVEIIMDYRGTINEIIGDSLLVIFGAPQEMEDRTQRAVACAVEMQNAMETVNRNNLELGLPSLEMGIGINDIEAVVGNIGSKKRSKYAVVGSGVNMTSRIESYSVGGQVLISESARTRIQEQVRISTTREIFPKGAGAPFNIHEVTGISGVFNQTLKFREMPFTQLKIPVPVSYTIIDGKRVIRKMHSAKIILMSDTGAEVLFVPPVPLMTNLRLRLASTSIAPIDFYAKVMDDGDANRQLVRFTFVPPRIKAYFKNQLLK